jgi:hypothetical protein
MSVALDRSLPTLGTIFAAAGYETANKDLVAPPLPKWKASAALAFFGL